VSDYRALHAYDGEDARHYDGRRFASMRGRTVDQLEWMLLRRGLRRLEAVAGPVSTVLDVPCGTGRMTLRLARSGRTVIAADASEDMLAIARSLCRGAEYVVGRVESLPLESLSVESLVSIRLMGHLPPDSRHAAFREFGRVASVGAVILYPGDSLWLRRRRVRQAAHGRILDPWYPMSAQDIRESARAGGFRVIQILGMLGPVAETRAVVLRKQA